MNIRVEVVYEGSKKKKLYEKNYYENNIKKKLWSLLISKEGKMKK